MNKPIASLSALWLALVLGIPGTRTRAEGLAGPFRVEALEDAPPEALSGPIREVLEGQGVRVLDGQGEPAFDLWLCRAIPASARPAGPKGAILYPVFEEGQLLGAVRFAREAADYHDQPIEPGVYTLRYGLQPVNGDHLGVSTNRDYALLVRAEIDKAVAPLAQKDLEKQSADAAGTTHPAVFLLAEAPGSGPAPGVARDEQEDRWGLVLPLALQVAGESQPIPLRVQMIFVGHGPV